MEFEIDATTPWHNRAVRFRFPLVVTIFLAGLMFTLLPRGIFGPNDIAARSLVCAATAAAAAMLLLVANKR